MHQTNFSLKNKKTVLINKEVLINYLYFLLDKIDPVYLDEITSSINKFINKLDDLREEHYE